ncbi:response regulator transcription factor [Labrys neptuniae]
MPAVPALSTLPRDALIARVLASSAPVIVIEASAGMGKSMLLRQIARRLGQPIHIGETAPGLSEPGTIILWDIPPGSRPAALPEPFLLGDGRIILAKRPETELPSLVRARAYGHSSVLATQDLLFTSDELTAHFEPDEAEKIMRETGGWPLLVSRWRRSPEDEPATELFLALELLPALDASALVELHALLNGTPVHPRHLERLSPFAGRSGGGQPQLAVEAIRQPLSGALRSVMSKRLDIPAEAKAIGEAYAARGDMTEAIITFQRAGFFDQALRIFTAARGEFFLYLHGPAAFDEVLAGFPHPFAMHSEIIVLSLALQALKRGDISLARRLLTERFGDSANELSVVFSPRSAFSREFRAFRLLMMIYEDVHFTDDLLELVFALLPEFPAEAHLLRGSFYNCVLEFYMRRRRLAEAEEIALHARYHYEQARVPMLTFYISLHQVIMRLMMGDALNARKYAADADRCLTRAAFESANDSRLLRLLHACIDYEGGRPEPLTQFLSLELDEFAHGEIWPSLIEFALQYGSQAFSEHFSTMAALAFLDRWRIYQIRNRQYRMLIEIREIAILQNGNRWQEAAERLGAIPSRINRAWMLSAGEELVRLADRDEISLALIWLRHLVYEMPTKAELEDLLGAMLVNLHLTERQRIAVEIWLAYACKRQRNLSKAQTQLQKTFEKAARLGSLAPLTEERIFLAELIEHRRIGELLDAASSIRPVLRRLRESALPAVSLPTSHPLSRRETRILMMICEGAANKFIAKALGLSEATVKFHLGNVYRKLGCRKRREAIDAARALGMVK